MQLLRLLQVLIDQHDCDYSAIKDCVTHAGKLWQTLDHNKLQQEFKERKEARKQQEDQRQPRDSQSQSHHQSDRQDSQQKDSQSRDKLQLQKQLSDEKHQHRKNNNLCLKCDYSGHQICDCEHLFNPNQVLSRKNKIKFQLIFF